eukprot:TRINITY_DN65803_c0_g1_i1.p1 TRINITY_DN65803_c0_g1~~TRINITY_DN65803_c0_g1_i1.p1  ORF type:complete len:473 (+),score=23.94 TRINITY_DN65803_c0_g1_i1:92-1510(+)
MTFKAGLSQSFGDMLQSRLWMLLVATCLPVTQCCYPGEAVLVRDTHVCEGQAICSGKQVGLHQGMATVLIGSAEAEVDAERVLWPASLGEHALSCVEMLLGPPKPPTFSKFEMAHCFKPVGPITPEACKDRRAFAGAFTDIYTFDRCCKNTALIRPFVERVRAVRQSLERCMLDDTVLGCPAGQGPADPKRCKAIHPISLKSVTGRTVTILKALWCLPRVQEADIHNVLDGFFGRGGTAHTTLHGFTHKGWTMTGFEPQKKVIQQARESLREFDQANIRIIASIMPESTQQDTHGVCPHGMDLAIMDAPELWLTPAWNTLEALCRPKFYMIQNANLPHHSGWWNDVLMAQNGWAEVMSGSSPDFEPQNSLHNKAFGGDPRSKDIARFRKWILLARISAEELTSTDFLTPTTSALTSTSTITTSSPSEPLETLTVASENTVSGYSDGYLFGGWVAAALAVLCLFGTRVCKWRF